MTSGEKGVDCVSTGVDCFSTNGFCRERRRRDLFLPSAHWNCAEIQFRILNIKNRAASKIVDGTL